MTDTDRALAGASSRARTNAPAFGVPRVEIGDPTPPPMEPLAPESIDGYESLSPETQAQFRAIHDVLREHDVGFARMWDTRRVGDEVSQMRAAMLSMIPTIRQLANVPQLLQVQANQISELRRWSTDLGAVHTKLDDTLGELNDRLREVEVNNARFEATVSTLSTRIGEAFGSSTKRIDKVETEVERLETSLVARIGSLETDRTRVKAWAALIGFLAAIAGWLVTRFGIPSSK
jgi:tetrahydromethanopterin S-methyltransferase subunit G